MKQKLNTYLTRISGYHLAKSSPNPVVDLFNSNWIKSMQLGTVIDVGANAGQFAKSVRAAMPAVQIISFEPIPAEYKKLNQAFAGDGNFTSYQCALGDETGTVAFQENEFSPASSIIETTGLQKEYYPVTGTTKLIEVEIARLDDKLKSSRLRKQVFLKIDVQGYEDRVIRGATELLRDVSVVYVECSFRQFYKDQPLFQDIYDLLRQQGFEFRGIGDQLKAGKNAEPVQIDALFVKNS